MERKHSWIRRLFQTGRAPYRRPQTVRPVMEQLEDRLVPTTNIIWGLGPIVGDLHPLTPGQSLPVNTEVARFTAYTNGAPDTNPGDFQAVIHWGDGTSSAGVLAPFVQGGYTYPDLLVEGSHSYAKAGNYNITVDLTPADSYSENNAVVNTATVTAPPPAQSSGGALGDILGAVAGGLGDALGGLGDPGADPSMDPGADPSMDPGSDPSMDPGSGQSDVPQLSQATPDLPTGDPGQSDGSSADNTPATDTTPSDNNALQSAVTPATDAPATDGSQTTADSTSATDSGAASAGPQAAPGADQAGGSTDDSAGGTDGSTPATDSGATGDGSQTVPGTDVSGSSNNAELDKLLAANTPQATPGSTTDGTSASATDGSAATNVQGSDVSNPSGPGNDAGQPQSVQLTGNLTEVGTASGTDAGQTTVTGTGAAGALATDAGQSTDNGQPAAPSQPTTTLPTSTENDGQPTAPFQSTTAGPTPTENAGTDTTQPSQGPTAPAPAVGGQGTSPSTFKLSTQMNVQKQARTAGTATTQPSQGPTAQTGGGQATSPSAAKLNTGTSVQKQGTQTNQTNGTAPWTPWVPFPTLDKSNTPLTSLTNPKASGADHSLPREAGRALNAVIAAPQELGHFLTQPVSETAKQNAQTLQGIANYLTNSPEKNHQNLMQGARQMNNGAAVGANMAAGKVLEGFIKTVKSGGPVGETPAPAPSEPQTGTPNEANGAGGSGGTGQGGNAQPGNASTGGAAGSQSSSTGGGAGGTQGGGTGGNNPSATTQLGQSGNPLKATISQQGPAAKQPAATGGSPAPSGSAPAPAAPSTPPPAPSKPTTFKPNLPPLRGRGVMYGGTDSLGRPKGIVAYITKEMIGTGSEASSSIRPPGYQSGKGFARGHLFGNQNGGTGRNIRNLVTLYQNGANTPVMSAFENQIRQVVESGQNVKLTVRPIYEGNQLIPKAVEIVAKGDNGYQQGFTVFNQPTPTGVKVPVFRVPAQ